MKKLIINPENPNGILVDMTSEEIAVSKIQYEKSLLDKKTIKEKLEEKANAKDSALAKLIALGLTEEEVKSIL